MSACGATLRPGAFGGEGREEARRHVEAVAEADAHLKGLLAELEAVATLRQAKYHLDQVGRGRAIAVYRDPATGEPLYRTPVIG